VDDKTPCRRCYLRFRVVVALRRVAVLFLVVVFRVLGFAFARPMPDTLAAVSAFFFADAILSAASFFAVFSTAVRYAFLAAVSRVFAPGFPSATLLAAFWMA
jgi:hypothetical protein